MNLNKLAKTCLKISKERENNGSNLKLKDILKHMSTEIIELAQAEIQYKLNNKSSFEEKLKKEFEEELADVIICCLIESELNELDIEKIIKNKIKKNKLRVEKKGDKL